jgi:hypothetical protein
VKGEPPGQARGFASRRPLGEIGTCVAAAPLIRSSATESNGSCGLLEEGRMGWVPGPEVLIITLMSLVPAGQRARGARPARVPR